ncbi:uncharacterized protein LOC121855676 [Homarus americanus]|uniref:uncharacterized protein LOC121855676 n=1 Tax=Homarus americanus TaxID=6706 RepID=UPI001C478ECE|nr:uncharacterized protein LOC121855676 [Homarus americanus]
MLCVWWVVVVVVVTRASAGSHCPVRTDARDVASKAYVSPQVVEAVVKEVGPSVPGQPYTVSLVVSKKLRAYSGPSRVKKRASLTLTFRHPLSDTDSEISAENSDSAGDCLVSAILKPRRKYLVFLSGPRERGAPPVPVAPPEPASRKLRRLVRKTVCKNCGEPPKVTGLLDDSVVENYNLTLECTVQGLPLPQVFWYKDDLPISTTRNLKVKTKTKKLRRRKLRQERSSSDMTGHRVLMGQPRRRLMRRRLRPRGVNERQEGGKRPAGGQRLPRGGRRQGAARREAKRRPAHDGGDARGGDARGSVRRRRPRPSSGNSSSSSRGRGSSNRKRSKKKGKKVSENKVVVSQLVMRSATEENDGIYKCVAKSVAGEAQAQARIRVVPPIDPHPFVDECPYAGYCLNGGTCMMFRIVGELVCQCAEGYKGQRCQEKEVYPTFNRSCHGPLRNIRHSHGRRCPRNQPAALWELLQQTLARKHKVSPWTKTQLLSWSPTHTGSAYWLHYMRPAQHSQTRPQSRGNNKTAPTLSGPGPTTSGLLQPPSSPGFLPLPHTTEHPEVLDSLLPDLDRSHVTRRRDPVGLSMPPSSPPAASQPVPTRTHGLRLTTPPSSLMRSVKHDAVQDPQLDILLHSPPPQLSEDSESEYAHHIRYKSRLRRRHHHRHHLTDPRDRPPHNSLEEAHVPQFTRPTGDQRMTSWSGLVPQGKPQHPVFSLPDHAPPAQPTTVTPLFHTGALSDKSFMLTQASLHSTC